MTRPLKLQCKSNFIITLIEAFNKSSIHHYTKARAKYIRVPIACFMSVLVIRIKAAVDQGNF